MRTYFGLDSLTRYDIAEYCNKHSLYITELEDIIEDFIYRYLSLNDIEDIDSEDGTRYQTGYDEGYETGHTDGYDEGRDEGYDEGYADGLRTSRRKEYLEGYDDAKNGKPKRDY